MKFSFRNSVTNIPMFVGYILFFSKPVFSSFTFSDILLFSKVSSLLLIIFPSLSSFTTYSLSLIFLTVSANVDGLPIPESSIFLIRLASEYLGGCLVKTSLERMLTVLRTDFSSSFGRSFELSSISLYSFRKPSKISTSPVALNSVLLTD